MKYIISATIIFLSLNACSSFGEAMKSATNSGYTSWSIEYIGPFSEASSLLIGILEDLEYEIDSNSATKIETKYRTGPPRYDEGGFFSALSRAGSNDHMIKLSIENKEVDGKSYLFFKTSTQVENRYSSYSRSQQSNPNWGTWEDELMFISEQIKDEIGNGEEMNRNFVRSTGDARIN